MGPGFTALIFDIRDRAAVDQAADKVRRMLGSQYLRAVVNNSGIAISGPLQHISIDKFREQQEVNVIGTLNVIQAFYLYLVLSNRRQTNPAK